mmetsp:Transcript_14134/g.22520  ORF Transcript_14134/g.22520 Transcript_14134/m.22520 type:complete len:173 (-) Transcript_14134:599-1117(-)
MLAEGVPEEVRDEWYRAEQQPTWVVVQYGEDSSAAAVPFKKLGLTVSELELEEGYTLHYLTPSKTTWSRFRTTCSVHDARTTPPDPGPAKGLWEAWRQEHAADYERVKAPRQAYVRLVNVLRKPMLGLTRAKRLEAVVEKGQGHFHLTLDGTVVCCAPDGSSSAPPICHYVA